MPTLVCVPITVHALESAVAEAIRSVEHGADLVELRADGFFSGDDPAAAAAMIRSITAASPLPVIVTCRSQAEGGEYEGDDDALAAFYRAVCDPHDAARLPRYIDVEHARFQRSAALRQAVRQIVADTSSGGHGNPSLILSFHDFNGRPADLFRKLATMREHAEPAVIKVAFRARSLRDALEALHLPDSSDRPMISLAMGEFGLISRVLAPKFGGMLTFASLRAATVTAPGQPTMAELLNLYNFHAIKPRTRVYGVVGWPLSHSRSPEFHNAAFRARGIDAAYLPLPIASGESDLESYASFKATILELLADDKLEFRGCSVTLPHKVNLLRLAEEQRWRIDPLAAAAGAANTLVVGDSGNLVFNSDVSAIIAALANHPRPRIAVVLGAGGAARAAIAALQSLGASIRVAARDSTKARAVAADAATVVPWDSPLAADVDLVINCTPVGMSSGSAPDESPVSREQLAVLPRSAVVFDTVYTPPVTPLLTAAQELGLATISGEAMFAAQAAKQFEAWTGTPPAGR
jgi:3-dehydroquinate dehydratase/shikimate dehydrogenase